MTLPVPNPTGPVDYASTSVPGEYHCGKCGALGIKLWREYQTFLNHQSLLCAACACVEQSENGKSYSIIESASGVTVTTTYDAKLQPQLHAMYGGRDSGGDQIGWRIPAVPTEDGVTYWGYTSVPQKGVDWWNRLPLRRPA